MLISTAYASLLLVALTANLFVVFITLGNKSACNPPFNLFIIHLAACDILYALVVCPVQLGYIYMQSTWFQGSFALFLCKLKDFSLVFVISASVFTLVVMAVDRYLAAAHVLRRPMAKKHVWISLALVWCVSGLFSASELYKFKTYTVRSRNLNVTLCIASWTRDPNQAENKMMAKVEFILKLILLYVIPLLTMVTLYGKIISFLWHRSASGTRRPAIQTSNRKRYRNIVHTLISMVAVFAGGWLPVHIVHLMSHFARSTTIRLPFVVYAFMFWTAHANCAVNPCLIFVFNQDYRNKLRRLANRLQACCSSLFIFCRLMKGRRKSYSCHNRGVTEIVCQRNSKEESTKTQDTKF